MPSTAPPLTPPYAEDGLTASYLDPVCEVPEGATSFGEGPWLPLSYAADGEGAAYIFAAVDDLTQIGTTVTGSTAVVYTAMSPGQRTYTALDGEFVPIAEATLDLPDCDAQPTPTTDPTDGSSSPDPSTAVPTSGETTNDSTGDDGAAAGPETPSVVQTDGASAPHDLAAPALLFALGAGALLIVGRHRPRRH